MIADEPSSCPADLFKGQSSWAETLAAAEALALAEDAQFALAEGSHIGEEYEVSIIFPRRPCCLHRATNAIVAFKLTNRIWVLAHTHRWRVAGLHWGKGGTPPRTRAW